MIVSEETRELLRERMDAEGAKIVAARAGVERTTLYGILRNRVASEMTLRKIGRAYPAIVSTTSTNSIEPIPA